MNEKDQEAMIRWQGYSREQRSAVNTLFLTYAAALIGLQSSILLGTSTQIFHARYFVTAASGALLSLGIGCIVVLLRLRDSRLTARTARLRVEQAAQADIDVLRRSTERLGKCTNGLIPVQVTAFVLAAMAFIIWIALTHGAKLSFSTAGK